MEYKSEPPNYLLTSMKSYQKLRDQLDATKKEIGVCRRRIADSSGIFITQRPLRSGADYGDAGYRSSEGHSEDSFSEGGNLHVTAPGMGSLSVTGSVGDKVGAKNKFGALATENLLEFGAGSQGTPMRRLEVWRR